MARKAFVILTLFLSPIVVFCQSQGYQIKIKIEGYTKKQIFLAYYYGDKQYIKDTAEVDISGNAVFEDNNKLEGGLYMILETPSKLIMNIIVDDKNQRFTIKSNYIDPIKNAKFMGSEDNQIYSNYIDFIKTKQIDQKELNKQFNESADTKQKEIINEKLQALDKEVLLYQKSIMNGNPGSLPAVLLRSERGLEYPVFTGTETEKKWKQYYWAKAHWFDIFDLKDERLVRTPNLSSKVEYYIDKLTYQQPDSIILSIDKFLSMLDANKEAYRVYLTQFLNKYAKLGNGTMDAVYAHIALKYYDKGKAPWTPKENIERIANEAKKIENLLIGKKAPDIVMQNMNSDKVSLYDFKAGITVLYFYDPECDKCKETVPYILKAFAKYVDKDLRIFTVNTTLSTESNTLGKWRDYIMKNNMENLYNTIDPFHNSGFKNLYNIYGTPQIYILDKEKKILSRKISGEELENVLQRILQQNN